MDHNTCKRGLIIAVLIILRMKISCTEISYIRGQASPDDPHACLWFIGLNESRCCDGYFKINEADLTDYCIECSSGYYGFLCWNKCYCENGGTCNSIDGSCHCSEQYFGNNCQYPCSCQNGATCMYDGICLCVDGFYGELCQHKCSCPEHSECHSERGECFCHEGFYGDSCLPCDCSNTEQCDPFSGACTCKPGYYGELCDKQCSCFNGAYCGNDHSDDCKCSIGWVGSECTDCDARNVKSNGLSFCKDKCLHCYNGHKCSVQNGDCLCSPGWQGKGCDHTCDEGFFGKNCSEVCQCKHGICHRMTGICLCESGWTGQHCEEPCPDNCLICMDDACQSCKRGWTGARCSRRCKTGFYGDGCQELCTECNCTTSCHHVNGNCHDIVRDNLRCEENNCKYQNAKVCLENPFKLECLDGWTGRFCDVKTSMATAMDDSLEYRTPDSSTPHEVESSTCMDEDSASSTLILILILIVTVSILINVAVVISACYYVKRQTRARNRHYDKIEVAEVEMEDIRQDENTSHYENIPGPRETAINSEEYQHLSDFTYSNYQKLDISVIGGSADRYQ